MEKESLKYQRLREEMVRQQIEARGITDRAVLEAMRKVPRHIFVSEALRDQAYGDFPLPIGEQQTISQPYIVAEMTQALQLSGEDRVLEIGTGSGYQAAILAEIAREVFTVEILEPLGREARERLAGLGYSNIRFAVGDGREGWPEEAPFDGILAAASAEEIPPRLLEQLAPGARLVLPLGVDQQDLWMITRTREGHVSRNDEKTPADFGADVAPRHKVVKTEEPPKRQAGVKVKSPAELVAKLKEAGAL